MSTITKDKDAIKPRGATGMLLPLRAHWDATKYWGTRGKIRTSLQPLDLRNR